MSRFVLLILAVVPAATYSQSVSTKGGNVILTATGRKTLQITSSGLDSDPKLSANKKLVVFVRRTPSSPIFTGAGPLDTNELWVAEAREGGNVRRILAGHSVEPKSDDLPFGGFSSPNFSLDANRVYFLAQIAATSQHVYLLDLKSEQVQFLCRGIGLEVINSGVNAGFLIVLKDIPRVMPGHVFRYWLLDRNGKEIGEIGEIGDEKELRAFKSGRF